MGKLRISVVEFLNTAPLVWGFTDGPLAGKYELLFAVPSQCAEDLRAGRADVGIIPSIEYQRMDDVVALPGMAIAAKNEVRSLLVVSKVPIELAKTFALDTNSRSSVGLARILSRRHWNISPEFIDLPPDAEEMLARADAGLLIGDPALRLRLRVDALQNKPPRAVNPSRADGAPITENVLGEPQADGCCCCDGEDEHPIKGIETLFVYDLAQQWREMTGLPAVLALWVARRSAVTPELATDFLASRDHGLSHVGDIAEGAALKLDLPPRELERYLTENIDYSLDEENLAGLRRYYEECARAGLIPRARAVEFVGATSDDDWKVGTRRAW